MVKYEGMLLLSSFSFWKCCNLLIMSMICFHSWLVAALNLASPLIVGWGKGTSSTLSTTSGLKYSLFFPLKLFGAKKRHLESFILS